MIDLGILRLGGLLLQDGLIGGLGVGDFDFDVGVWLLAGLL